MKSKVSSEELTGDSDVTNWRQIRQGERLPEVAEPSPFRPLGNFFPRTFYISPAKFTSFTVQNCVQQG
jgi:hypothetical protein